MQNRLLATVRRKSTRPRAFDLVLYVQSTHSLLMSNAIKIVWSVADMFSNADVATFLVEVDAIAFARSINVGPVPQYQVEWSHVVGGRAV